MIKLVKVILAAVIVTAWNGVVWYFALDMWKVSDGDHQAMSLTLTIVTNIMALACTAFSLSIIRNFSK